ncbi:MAG: nucleotidyltransferase domain-containing protein [Planctomycetota bacterium]|nr:nucleotidyltransferase domain-containing protein [Planctomycetota bacterium]
MIREARMGTEQIGEVVDAIVERFHPRRVVLFGSYARGDAHADSDVDLLVEMETSASPPERVMQISRLFGRRRWSLDVVVYTPEEVQRLRAVTGTLVSVVEAEGKVLYERP